MAKAVLIAIAGLALLVALVSMAAALVAMPRVLTGSAALGVFGLLVLLGTAFWVWMIVDVATNEPDQGNTKIVWLLIVLLGQFLGAVIYFFVRRPQRLAGHAS